jgi:TP901 family phage tail tape measure protein
VAGSTSLAELALVVRADMNRVKPDVVRGSDDAGRAGGKKLADSLGQNFGTRINAQLRNLNIKQIDLKLSPAKAQAAIDATEKKLKKLRDDSSKSYEIRVKADEALQEIEHLDGRLGAIKKRSADLDQVTDAAGALGLGLLGAAGTAVKFGADFDKQMSAVAAAAGGTADEVDKLRAAAVQAGADTQYSATEAAAGITELSKAGVQTADILNGGLKGALSLAAAGQIDVADAAETAASAMTQFKLSGAQIPHIADLLAAGAGKAQGSVADLSAALGQAGLVAAGTGLSVEDTTGTLAAFASAGLTGSDAGTSFKTMLQALQAPTGKTKDLMDTLGISAYDASGNFIGITKLAGQLKDKLGTLTPELRANALAQIFGSDAVRAASILYENGQEGIQGWIDKTNDAGFAAKTAAKLTDNLSGDLERLKGALETQFIKGGSGAGGGLRTLTQFLNSLVDNFGRLPDAVSGSIVVLAGLGGAALVAGAGFLKAKQKLGELRTELVATGPAGAKTADGIGKVASAAGKAATAIAIWQAAMAASDQFSDKIAANTEAMAFGLEKFGQGADLAGNSAQVLGKNLDNLKPGFKFLADSDSARSKTVKNLQQGLEDVIPGLNSYNTSLANTQTQITAVDTALSSMVASGNLDGANAAFKRLSDELAVNGVSVDEVKKQFPQYAAAVEAASDKAAGLAGASGKATAATDDLGNAAEQSAEQAKTLADAFDDLFNRYESADKAAINYQRALTATTKELKDGTKTLSLNTEEGLNNRDSILALVDSIDAQRTANINNGESVKDADRKYENQIQTLIKNAKNLGYNSDQVDKLLGRYKQIPRKVDTPIKQPGMADSLEKTQKLFDKLNSIDQPWVANIKTKGYADVANKLRHLLAAQKAAKEGTSVNEANRELGHFFDAGGWTGPGPKMKPAGIVHADEFVIRKDSRMKIEEQAPGLLTTMNQTGTIPKGYGYAGGGVVLPFPFDTSKTKIPVVDFTGAIGKWPSSPSAQRGDSGVWRSIRALIQSTGPISGSFGNGYRPGDPLWHGSGRAVDWMGYKQDRLAHFFLGMQGKILEMIHRTPTRDYAYTRGQNKGSFNEGLMNAHRNHLHIAMSGGGRVPDGGISKVAVADTGRVTLDQGWNLVGNGTGRPESLSTDGAGGVHIHLHNSVISSRQQFEDMMVGAWTSAVQRKRITVKPS